MIENEDLPAMEKPRRFHFEWVLPLLYLPRKTLGKVIEAKAGWLTPLLVVTVLVAVAVLAAAPIRKQVAQNTSPELPEYVDYFTPEQQQQFYDSQAQKTRRMYTTVFPGVSAELSLWAEWLVLGGLLYLVLTLLGSRSDSASTMSLTAWSVLPLGVRALVQTVAALVGKELVTNPGLSGFIAAGSGGFMQYIKFFLGSIDIYLIWQTVLLVIGARMLSGLKTNRAIAGVLISVFLLLLLAALPGFIGAKLSGLSSGGTGFFIF
ncbi:MAG: YIP1 family protein [Anaerolineaceae bacterium]